jgi:hypothetical protein
MKSEPYAVWISTDIPVDLPKVASGSLPKDHIDLLNFSEAVNIYLVAHGAAWARYLLFDENGKPNLEYSYEFSSK